MSQSTNPNVVTLTVTQEAALFIIDCVADRPFKQVAPLLNEVFVTDQLTDKDMVNYAYTIRDKVGENTKVMKQIENNSPEQAMLGDFSKAIDDAIMDSSEAHQNQMMQLLADPGKAANFARVVFDLLVQGNPPHIHRYEK